MSVRKVGRPRERWNEVDAALIARTGLGLKLVLGGMIDANLSCRAMSDRLKSLTDLKVPWATVLRWAHEVENERKTAARAAVGGASETGG